ncbi:unnamed protein product, partial [Amoebophrya sp. A120]
PTDIPRGRPRSRGLSRAAPAGPAPSCSSSCSVGADNLLSSSMVFNNSASITSKGEKDNERQEVSKVQKKKRTKVKR